jgi:putative cell wall-binding protein
MRASSIPSRRLSVLLSVLLVTTAILPLLSATPASAVPATTISGTIRETGGAGLPGVEVFALDPAGDPQAAAHATSGVDGAYTLTLPAGGTFVLAATEATHTGSFYGGTSMATAGGVAVGTGATVTGKDITLARSLRRAVTAPGTALQPRSASRLLYKRSPRISGTRALWFDDEGVTLADGIDGTPTRSLIATSAFAADLNGTYAFVGTRRVQLSNPSNVDTAFGSDPDDVACDDAQVAYTTSTYDPASLTAPVVTTLSVLDAATLASVFTTTIASADGVALAPGSVGGGRVAVVVGGERVIVYNTASGTKDRDFTPTQSFAVSAVLSGNELAWTDGVTLKHKNLGSGTATATVRTVADPRVLNTLRAAGGGRVAVWEADDASFAENGGYLANELAVYDLDAGTRVVPFSFDTTLSGGFDGAYDVSDDRTVWLEGFPADAQYLDGYSAREVHEVKDTPAGTEARIDVDRYGLADQWAPSIIGGRVAYLDDSAHPEAPSTIGDLMLKTVGAAASQVETLDTDVVDFGFDTPVVLTPSLVAYAKVGAPAPTDPSVSSLDLWVYDRTAHLASRVDTLSSFGDECAFGAWGDWVVYQGETPTGFALKATDPASGATRTLVGTAEPIAFAVSNGKVLYVDDNGDTWAHDLATNSTRASAFPPDSVYQDGVGGSPLYYPHLAFDTFAGFWPGSPGDATWFDLGSSSIRSLETGEEFETDPFALLGFAPGVTIGDDFRFRGNELYDIGTGVAHVLPVAPDSIGEGAADGGTAVFETNDTYSSELRVWDLSNEPHMMKRLAGANRYATGVALSQDMTSAATVVIATGKDFPDALAGAPLAYAVHGPVLLTDPGALPSSVASEVARLGATKAYILGGTKSVSAAVEAQLKAQTHVTTVQRIAGSSRWQTATMIAGELKAVKGGGALGTAFLTTGRDFPDALSAASIAARMGAPILLTDPVTLPAVTKAALTSLGITRTYVLGGTKSVSAGVMAQAPGAVRVNGSNRYDTAVQIVQQIGLANHAVDAHSLVFTVGNAFPDALGAGTRAARTGVPLLLVDKTTPTALPGSLATFLTAHKSEVTTSPVVVGGEPTICLRLQQAMARALW